MKSILFILCSAIFIINACSNSNEKVAVSSSFGFVKDTAKIAAIDSIVFSINQQWKPGPSLFVVPFNGKDTIQYLEINGEPQRISSMFFTDTSLTWVVFHQVNNERKLVRLRQRLETPKPSVKEVLAYYDGGKMFFTAERSKVLQEGEETGAFRSLPFIENAHSAAEVEALYSDYWEVTKKAIEADKAK